MIFFFSAEFGDFGGFLYMPNSFILLPNWDDMTQGGGRAAAGRPVPSSELKVFNGSSAHAAAEGS
jgi:hypothetical protein